MEILILLVGLGIGYLMFKDSLFKSGSSADENSNAEPQALLVPEDSTLNRHYQAGLEAEREVITNPYPTDSALRRHYETHVASLIAVPEVQAAVKPAKSVKSASKPAAKVATAAAKAPKTPKASAEKPKAPAKPKEKTVKKAPAKPAKSKPKTKEQ